MISTFLPSLLPRSPTRIIAVVLVLFLFFQVLHFRRAESALTEALFRKDETNECEGLEGLKDVFVLLRTGTTEAPKKLAAHFATTMRCVPNYAIFSDYEETIDGHRILNALDEVNPDIIATHRDFEYYRRLQGKGREAFTPQEIAQWAAAKNTMSGHDSPAWRLDKWKFLPLADKAFRQSPDSKWYIFIESDSFILWRSLLEWLSKIDASKPWYLGMQMQIGDVIFAYGGAGFAISNPAMKKVVEHRNANLKFYDDFTAGHWAGDCVLGKALLDAGVPLTWAFPTLSGDAPADMAFDTGFGGAERKPWCFYAASYHHIPPAEYADFYEFERNWNLENGTFLRHNDVFRNYVQPRFRPQLVDWDNLSESEQTSVSSFGACREACENQPECLQFSISGYSCKTSTELKLGRRTSAAAQITSGWMMDRIDDFVKRMDETCKSQDWIIPN